MTLAGAPGGHPIRCWEWRSCGRTDCKAYKSDDLRCWLLPHASCPDGSLQVAERLVSDCSYCPVYAANRERATGKRLSDRAALDTVDALLAEAIEQSAIVSRAEAESRGKSAQVTLLSEVGRALQRSTDIDEILLVILTAATAGGGLGFNRAFLLLVDEPTLSLRGRMAVGPSHPREAAAIWHAVEAEGRSLGEMLAGLSSRGRDRGGGIDRLAEQLVCPLEDEANPVSRSLIDGRAAVIAGAGESSGARELSRILGTDHFLIVPLIAEGKKLGAIIADNLITGREIRDRDVKLLETFASQAGLAILNASLHQKLRERIAELERAHEELSMSQLQLLRAERVLAAGGLAATLIHDLKAPVVSIGLIARAAASELAASSPIKETLDRISQEILRIEDYLRHFARSAGRAGGKAERIDIAQLIQDSVGALGTVIARGKIETAIDLGHGDCQIHGSKMELRQVLVNLLYNSVEAMPGGGRIRISTGVDRGFVRISVEDTGAGIPEDLKARVFSPFFTTKPDGSGLGLVIAKRTVTNYGGRISVESRQGTGTCFTIDLPVAK